jgi:hypothetical protein
LLSIVKEVRDMDEEFLNKVNGAITRLEAEGLTETAACLKQATLEFRDDEIATVRFAQSLLFSNDRKSLRSIN